MIFSKRSNTASAKGRDALCVPVQKVKVMEDVSDNGRVASDRALVSDQAAARLGPSGFDPSRAWRTDTPEFMARPIYQFVLLEGYQEHSGRLWHRLFAGTAMIDGTGGGRFGYRTLDIDRIQRDGDMIVVERVKGWVPASWPRWDWFTPCDSDGSPQGGDGLPGPVHDSADPKGIAQGDVA